MQAPVHAGARGLAAVRQLSANQVRFFESTFRPGPGPVRLDLGPRWLTPQAFVAHSPRSAEEVLSAKSFAGYTKDDQRFYREMKIALGDGILMVSGEEWTRQKRLLQPVFTRSRVHGYLDLMVDAIDELATRWRHGGTVDLGEGLTHLTLRVVARALLGADSETFEAVVRQQFAALNSGTLARASLPFPIPLAVPFRFNRELRHARDELWGVCDTLIARRRAEGAVGDDLTSLLIRARDGDARLSDTEVRDQVLVFLLAGHETTSTSLTFALHLLGKHPEVQDRVRAEARAVLGDRRPTAAEVTSSLPLTTAVVKEAMRLFPAAPFTGRRAVADCQLEGCDVPAGSDVIISVWTLHRREDLWPDPLRFEPDRFLGENHRDRYAWIPFGAGPRACIGQHFAMLESVAAVALLVRDHEFRAPAGSPEHPEVGSGITLYPTAPILSEVRPVTRMGQPQPGRTQPARDGSG